jgi:hypothetical protein
VAVTLCKKWQKKWKLCGRIQENTSVQNLIHKVAKNVVDFKIGAINNLFIPNILGVVKSGKLSGRISGNDVSSKHGRNVAEICC